MNHPLTILDGAMGTELRARGVKVADYKSSIWSAFAILEAPQAIIQLHADYIRAGASVITANNYSLTRPMLKREGIEDQLESMLVKAIELARRAKEIAENPTVKIAASLPPLETSFRADLVGNYADNLTAYREMVSIAAPMVDMFICETMTTTAEALSAATAATKSGKPTWVSWTIAPDRGTLRGGEDIVKAVQALKHLPIEGMLFNCSDCGTASKLLPRLRALTDLPIGAYCNPVLHEPHNSEGEPQQVPEKLLSPDDYAAIAQEWIAAGATLIGGCCDTNPEYIRKLNALS